MKMFEPDELLAMAAGGICSAATAAALHPWQAYDVLIVLAVGFFVTWSALRLARQ